MHGLMVVESLVPSQLAWRKSLTIYDLLGPQGYKQLYREHLASAKADVADWHGWVERLGLPLTGQLLDVGCGLGERTAAWSAYGYDVAGIDRSELMIVEARSQFPELSLLKLDAAAVSQLGYFELATAHFNFLMMLSDREVHAFLKNLRRCVPSGSAFLTDVCRPRVPICAFREAWTVGDRTLVDAGEPTDYGFRHTWTEGDVRVAKESFFLRQRKDYAKIARATGWSVRFIDWKADDQFTHDLMIFEP